MKAALVAVLALVSMMFTGNLLAQPTPYPEKDSDFPGRGVVRKFAWMVDNRNYFWSVREKNQGAVVFAGDSLTGSWKEVGKAFPGLKVANRGIGGDVSRGLLFRFQEDVLDLNPKAVVILVGLNDLTAHGKPADTLANITAMLDQAQKHNAQLPVVLCTIPETQNPKAPVREPDRNAINDGIRKLAAEREQVELCDVEKAIAGPNGEFVPENFGQDKLHLVAAGYQRWGEALKPVLDNLKLETK